MFQQNTGKVLRGLQFENEVHKQRVRLLQKEKDVF